MRRPILPAVPVLDTPTIPAGAPVATQRIRSFSGINYVVNTGVLCTAGVSEPSIDAALTAAGSSDTIIICPKAGGWPVDGSDRTSSAASIW